MNSSYRQRGMTLIEVMVALTLGLIVTGVISAFFLNSHQSSKEDQNLARMQENARFALHVLRTDLQHVDFYGDVVDGGSAVTVDSTTVPTGGDCGDGANPWLYATTVAENRFNYLHAPADPTATYSCISNFKGGTDVLAIQRARGWPIVAPATPDNVIYLRANGSSGTVVYNGGSLGAPGANETDWEWLAHIYYVNTDSELIRERLSGGAMQAETLVDGIEEFRIEFGIDTGNDGTPNRYTADPDPVTGWGSAVTARIYVLARTPDEIATVPDTKEYWLGSKGPIGPKNDKYYRRVYTTTVMLRNLDYRRGLGKR